MPLLPNDFLKQFFAFLENATEPERYVRRDGLQQVCETIQDREFRSNVRWLTRRIDEEILNRLK